MKKITFLLMLSLVINTVNAQTIFDFDTNALDNGDNITETIDGIGLTFTGESDTNLLEGFGFGGSSGKLAVSSVGATSTLVTFTFGQAVDVNSILPLDGFGGNLDFTFTPTGGSNSPVVVSMVDGSAPGVTVDLNWTGVTSFTVTTVSPVQFAFDNLSVSSLYTPTVFEWETAVDNGNNISETIDGITATFKNEDDIDGASTFVYDYGDILGTTGNVLATGSSNLVTFTFSKAVNVNSVIVLDTRLRDGRELTITPTGGTNSPIVVTLVSGVVPGDGKLYLNWTDVTSFAIQVTASPLSLSVDFRFDNLSIFSEPPLSVADDNNRKQKIKVYPNPIENMLHVKNISGLKSINVYNSLGQLVIESKLDIINVSHLSKGLYLIQIHTNQGIETKKIIKK